jgi:hypothetical protein
MSETDAVRVKLTKPSHIWGMAVASGMADAKDLLEKLPAAVRNTPGIALAIATIDAEAAKQRADVIQKNLSAVARAGHPVGLFKSISFDVMKSELICHFYDPDLFDSEAIE